MSNRILLLDAAWRVDRVIGPRYAVEMLYDGRVIPASDEIAQVMRSPSIEIQIPSVVARVDGRSIRSGRTPACTPRNVCVRDAHICQFVIDRRPCCARADTADHVYARALGGGGHWENLVASCRVHNAEKRMRTLADMTRTAGWTLRREPFVPTRSLLTKNEIGANALGAWAPFLIG